MTCPTLARSSTSAAATENLDSVLAHYPSIEGMLFDLPHVVEAAGHNFQSAKPTTRCVRWRQLLRKIPSGGDVYLLRHIIHDWYDEQSTQILTAVRRAMHQGPNCWWSRA